VKVTQGQTITLVNVSDAAHTFTVTGQGIDSRPCRARPPR
jgi:hypothetical protein